MSWFKAFDLKQNKKTESTERRKISFPKEIVENADLQKPVLNKAMTTQEYWVKHNFVAPSTSYMGAGYAGNFYFESLVARSLLSQLYLG